MDSGVEENASNTANYEEIEGHVRILGAKLSQMTASNANATSTLEDLQDYYERGLQMRVYRIQTLEELLKEQKKDAQLFKSRVHEALMAVAVGCTVIYAVLNPRMAISLIQQSWSYIFVALFAIFVARLKL